MWYNNYDIDGIVCRIGNTDKADVPIRHTWQDKAGGYGIQEPFGMKHIKSINGDYYNVVGLPISRLYRLLKDEFDIDL